MSSSSTSILVVCTGNVCRSPWAADALRSLLGPASTVEVSSAGTHARVGDAADPLAVAHAVGGGTDLARHSSRPLTATDVERADLILTAEREHRAAATRLVPSAVRRSFTLLEFAAVHDTLGVDAELRADLAHAHGFAERVALLSAHRGLITPRRGASFDVADPYRRGRRAFASAVDAMSPAIDSVVRFVRGDS